MITVVSGLPRSGTSMMMQALQAGGMPVLTDNVRRADEDNPRGYFELEQVKTTRADASWLPAAEGKAVKVVSALLYDLPPDREYRIVFMSRNVDEVLASQAEMLKRMDKPADGPGDGEMRRHYENHLKALLEWLAKQKNMKVLICDYGAMVGDPRSYVMRIAEFLGAELDIDRMAGVVDPSLYRARRA